MTYASREDGRYDQARDREFYSPARRFLRREDLADLRGLLIGSDDTIEEGLSQLGIDPDDFELSDIRAIKRDLGLTYDKEECCWVEED
jgi:hypothetical protein